MRRSFYLPLIAPSLIALPLAACNSGGPTVTASNASASEVQAKVAAATGNATVARRTQGLTQREQAVLKGVFEGFTNKEIGARLAISESSVKAVLQQLFEKTGVRTRSQLVRIALEKHSDEWLTNPT